jgi:hypothetical protein
MIEVMVRPVLSDVRVQVDWMPMGLRLTGAMSGGLRLALTGEAVWRLGPPSWTVVGWELTFTDGDGTWASAIEEGEQDPTYTGDRNLTLTGDAPAASEGTG